MSSITLTRLSECANQNHVIIQVTGDVTYTYYGDMDDLTSPVTEDEKDAFVKCLLRIAKIGRTKAQVRSALTAGHTVTI